MPHGDTTTKHDFGGWATVFGLKCRDGKTITRQAFKEMDGKTVPIVWQHGHDDVKNVLGHGVLEHRDRGLYLYGYFNKSKGGLAAKEAVLHKDINALSIYANDLQLSPGGVVIHGVIREASLVLSGANPGALIDHLTLQHGDEFEPIDDEAIIYTGEELYLDFEERPDWDELQHGDGDTMTVGEVFDTLNENQKDLFYLFARSTLLEESEDKEQAVHSATKGAIMKKNVFSKDADQSESSESLDFPTIKAEAVSSGGSLKNAVLAHAGTYGIGSDRANLELLFPDAQTVTAEPSWIKRRAEWVAAVLGGVKHSPFARIKSLHADITADEARAKGYITGEQKVSEVFPVLRRVTVPTTIYKLQKLDRDDVLDITDFDVVRWLKGEMRGMLDEEIATAILVDDGRDPASPDKIKTDNLRPIWQDDPLYAHMIVVPEAGDDMDLIDAVIEHRLYYRGTGQPTCFAAPSLVTAWLLMRDTEGHRLYRTKSELAAEMGVKEVVEVPAMEGRFYIHDMSDNRYLRAIIVNMSDYTVGADRGGEVNFFDDFDIDFNRYTYLTETRISGALTVPKSAVVVAQDVAI